MSYVKVIGVNQLTALTFLSKLYETAYEKLDISTKKADDGKIDFPTLVAPSSDLDAVVEAGLLELAEKDLKITQKVLDLLQAAAKNQKKLDEEGFHSCFCCHTC